MKSIHLYQVASNGRIKHLIIEANGDKLTTTWYTSKDGKDGKAQSTTETIAGVNAGKANELVAEAQCEMEWERKVVTKKEEGYVESLDAAMAATEGELEITERLPVEFAPCKPVSEPPADALTGGWTAERKFNGICLILHNTGVERIAYSRRMIDITKIVSCVPDLAAKLAAIPVGTVVLGELVARKDDVENTHVLKGVTHDKTTPEKAKARYSELVADGWDVNFQPYELYFYNGMDYTGKPFSERNKVLENLFGKRELYPLTQKAVADAKKRGWEGFILRKMDATIGYTMNGKPKRQGAYKYKFISTDDVVVVGISNGAGKHEKRVARFKIAQYHNGKLVDSGWCGLGQLGEKVADELTAQFTKAGYTVTAGEQEIDPKDYIVLEIEYQSRQDWNDKGQRCYEFPIPVRVRDLNEKAPQDCVMGE